MSTILLIETATTVCSVALVCNDTILDIRETSDKNSHASVVAVFIDELLKENSILPGQIDAVAVSKGPGSYTGLRIGVSTAKGLCYALDKPLISVGSLESMAYGMAGLFSGPHNLPVLFAPMIDARRMEVYTALYDDKMNCILPVCAEIIDENSFSAFRENHLLVIAGDGAEKCRSVLEHPNVIFLDDFAVSAKYMLMPVLQKFNTSEFEDTAYFEPYYLKEFVAGTPKVKGLK